MSTQLPLRPQSKELVKGAKAAQGQIHVLETSQTGRWVRVGQKDYADGPQQQRLYWDALQELVQAGHAEHVSGALYELTSAGWDLPEE